MKLFQKGFRMSAVTKWLSAVVTDGVSRLYTGACDFARGFFFVCCGAVQLVASSLAFLFTVSFDFARSVGGRAMVFAGCAAFGFFAFVKFVFVHFGTFFSIAIVSLALSAVARAEIVRTVPVEASVVRVTVASADVGSAYTVVPVVNETVAPVETRRVVARVVVHGVVVPGASVEVWQVAVVQPRVSRSQDRANWDGSMVRLCPAITRVSWVHA